MLRRFRTFTVRITKERMRLSSEVTGGEKMTLRPNKGYVVEAGFNFIAANFVPGPILYCLHSAARSSTCQLMTFCFQKCIDVAYQFIFYAHLIFYEILLLKMQRGMCENDTA